MPAKNGGYTGAAMRVFAFGREHGRTHKRRHRRLRGEGRASTDATAPRVHPEPLDRQIASLLVSLEQPSDAAVGSTSPSPDEFVPAATVPEQKARRAPTPLRPEPGRRRRSRRSTRARVDRIDLYIVLSAVVLGVAVGILTAFLLNS